jgi:PleD family two-component response regulator
VTCCAATAERNSVWDGQEISEELVARADRALYQAKDAGRDRIVAAGQNILESR